MPSVLGDAPRRDEHAPGRDQARDARGLGTRDCLRRALRGLERLVEHRAVEIHRDSAHGARVEPRRQLQHGRSAGDGAFYLPATDAT